MLCPFDLIIRLSAHHVPEAHEKLYQERDGIALSVRRERRHHLAGKTVVGRCAQYRPRVSCGGGVGAVIFAIAGRCDVRLEPLLGPLAVVDVRDLHDRTRSLKSLTPTVRSHRTGMPAAT